MQHQTGLDFLWLRTLSMKSFEWAYSLYIWSKNSVPLLPCISLVSPVQLATDPTGITNLSTGIQHTNKEQHMFRLLEETQYGMTGFRYWWTNTHTGNPCLWKLTTVNTRWKDSKYIPFMFSDLVSSWKKILTHSAQILCWIHCIEFKLSPSNMAKPFQISWEETEGCYCITWIWHDILKFIKKDSWVLKTSEMRYGIIFKDLC